MLNLQPSQTSARLPVLVFGLWLLALITIPTRAQENSPPTIGPLKDVVIAESENYSVVIPATDADVPSQALTFSLDEPVPAGATINATLGLFSWTPSETQGPGVYTLTVRVSDNGSPSLSSSLQFQIVVAELNRPPIVAPVDNQTVAELTLLTVQLNATDPDSPAQPLVYTLAQESPPGATLDPITGVFTWTPTEEQGPSTNTLYFRVSEAFDGGLAVTNAFQVVVTESNQRPVWLPFTIDPLLEDYTFLLAVEAVDPDIPANHLTYTLAPGSPDWATMLDPASGLLSLALDESMGGTSAFITVQVTDDGNPPLTETMVIPIQVQDWNSPPVLSGAVNRSVLEGDPVEFVAGSDADIPPNTLHFEFVDAAPPGASLDPASGLFRWTPSETDGPSTNIITIAVSDDGDPSERAERTFQIIVRERNQPPDLLPIADQELVEGTPMVLAASATDSDFPTNSISFTLGPGTPTEARIDPVSGVIRWEPTERDGPGEYIFGVIATDTGNPPLSASRSFRVRVSELNLAPQAKISGTREILELERFSCLLAEDPDVPPNHLTFELLSPLPQGAEFDPDTGWLVWEPDEVTGPSSHEIRFRVTDDGVPALTMEGAFTLVVREVNLPPFLNAPTNIVMTEGEVLSFIAGGDPDLPANLVTFSLEGSVPAGATLDSESGQFTWITTEVDGPSTNRFVIRVTDGGDLPLDQAATFTVVVRERNEPPVLQPIDDLHVDEGQTVALTAHASDPDLPANTMVWSLAPGSPPGATIDPSSGEFRWTPDESAGPGSYPITVKATDDGVPPLTSEQSFTIEVRELNTAPSIAAPTEQTIDEGTALSLGISDADLPANKLSYAILAPPKTIRFEWQANAETNVAGYRLYSKSAAETNWSLVADLPDRLATHHDLSGVQPGTLHQFQLTAYDLSGEESPPSAVIQFAAPAFDPVSGTVEWVPGDLFGGTVQQFRVRIEDDGTPSLGVEQDFHVTIRDFNKPPRFTLLPDRVFEEEQIVEFPVRVIDDDIPQDILIYALEPGTPPWVSIDPQTGQMRLEMGEELGGSQHVIGIRVSDNGSPPMVTSQTFTLQILEANRPPVIPAIAPQTVAEDEFFALQVIALDPDSPKQHLSYSLSTNAPAGMGIDPQTGWLTWVPSEDEGGSTHHITVLVADEGVPALTSEASFDLLVLESNRPPLVSPVAPSSIPEGAPWQLHIVASDPDIPANTLRFNLVDPAPPSMSIDPETGTLTWIPSETDGPSTNLIQVRVADDGIPPQETVILFSLVVLEVNEGPTMVTPFPQTLSEGATLDLHLQASDADLPANSLSFHLGSGSPAGVTLDSATGQLVWTPTEKQGPGSYDIPVEVVDDGTPPLAATTSVRVEVLEVNRPPSLTSPPDQFLPEDQPWTLALTATDPDQPANDLRFSLLSELPTGTTFDPTSARLTWTPTEQQGPGLYTVRVRITDDGIPPLSTDAELRLHVTEVNLAPTLSLPIVDPVPEEKEFHFRASANDSDIPPNRLQFSLEPGAPAGASIDPSTGVFVWRPDESQGPGTFSLGIRVTDDGSPPLSASRTATIVVEEVNLPPRLIAPSDTETYPLVPLSLASLSQDPDLPANRLTFILERGPEGAVLDPVTGVLTWKPSLDQADQTFPIKIAVEDSGIPALSAKTNFNIRVLPLPPTSLRLTQTTDGAIALEVTGAPGVTYCIWQSTDLLTWDELLTVTAPADTFQVPLPAETAASSFYRVQAR